jgi:hypothetical protein
MFQEHINFMITVAMHAGLRGVQYIMDQICKLTTGLQTLLHVTLLGLEHFWKTARCTNVTNRVILSQGCKNPGSLVSTAINFVNWRLIRSVKFF